MPNWKKVVVSGSEAEFPSISTSNNFTIDAGGDIIFDAEGTDIKFKDDGTEFGRLAKNSSDFVIKSIISDKDLLFKGVDDGATITALSLDMSEGGNAEFSGNVSGSSTSTGSFGHVHIADGLAGLGVGNDNDLVIYHDGSHSYIKDNGTGNLYYRGGTQTIQNAAGSKTMAVFNAANSVDLNYNNSTKFQTTNTGVSVTGNVIPSGDVSGSATSTGSFGHVLVDGTSIFGDGNGNHLGVGGVHPPGTIDGWNGTGNVTILNVQDLDRSHGARVAIQGSDASLDLVDTGATGDKRWFTIYNQDDMVYMRGLNTAGSAVTHEFISFDLDTGYLGINDDSPSYQLDVAGTGRFTGALTLDSTISNVDTTHVTASGNISGSASSTGSFGHLVIDKDAHIGEDVLADGDVVAYNSSDERLKDNIEVIQGSLDKIGEIRGVEFDWNEKSPGWAKERGHDVGVIAQEVQKVVPEIVVERKNGYLGVDYKRIVPLLIESVKELKQEIEILKKKVN